MSVIIETTAGDFTVDLFTNFRPKTCMNFLKLCKMKYYNYNLFFSVERNFIAQTGDPTATGKGGECIYRKMFGDQAKFYEGEKLPILKHQELGTLSMVSCGNHLFGSQFFITLGENLDSLDAEHLVFGQIVEGFEFLNLLNKTLTDENNRPYQDIRITHTVILDDPYPDPKEIEFPDESPRPSLDMLESDYIAADENIDDTDGKTMAEIQEEIEEREAKARATILEMVGDLPDSDMAPPENVLFVCKLNPVTTSDDLEIIFSRFGKIKSCEVIRDRITNNSLQYAFIEFAETKSCEDAYFKMDNVLIDDRRIHVDFSQSVSKIKWRGKGRGIEYYDDNGKRVDGKRDLPFNFDKDEASRTKKSGQSQSLRTNSHQWDYKETHSSSHSNNMSHREASTNSKDRDTHFQKSDKNGKGLSQNGFKGENEQHSDSSKNILVAGVKLKNEEEREKMLKCLKKSIKKKKKKRKKISDSDSDSDSSDRREKKHKMKKKLKDIKEDLDLVRKERKKKKKKKHSEVDSSDSDSEPKKKLKKAKKSKKKKKRKRVSSTSSSSSD